MEAITGNVTRVNGNSLQLDAREGTMTISKYAEPRPALPAVGDRVRVSLDKSGFIRAIAVLGSTPVEETPEPALSPSPVHGADDRTAVRLAVLQAAATFLATRPDARTTDVETVAAKWEAWVLR